jgi:Family of unknown function (DUF5522)/Cysteine-rich CWC
VVSLERKRGLATAELKSRMPHKPFPEEDQALALQSGERCPVCGNPNHCRIAAGYAYKGDCWCNESRVPTHILHFVAEKFETACLCERCLEGLAYYGKLSQDPREILDLLHREIRKDPASLDFYIDDQGNTVFTAAYHLKRGHCCENDCRHCPYSFRAEHSSS